MGNSACGIQQFTYLAFFFLFALFLVLKHERSEASTSHKYLNTLKR